MRRLKHYSTGELILYITIDALLIALFLRIFIAQLQGKAPLDGMLLFAEIVIIGLAIALLYELFRKKKN